MEKIIALFGKSLVAIILLSVLTIVANATIVPAVTETANLLNQVNWYGHIQLCHLVMRYTFWGIFCLYAVMLAFKTTKKTTPTEEKTTD